MEKLLKFVKDVLLKEMGLDEATITALTKENVTDAELAALIPKITGQNRLKWEGVLGADGKFTEQFTSKGHSAGTAKAYRDLKLQFSKEFGIDLSEESEDFKDNPKFLAKVKDVFAKSKGKGSEDVEAAIAKVRSEMESAMAAKVKEAQDKAAIDYLAKENSLKREFGLKQTLTDFLTKGKIKEGLSLSDVLLLAETNLKKGYKLEFDEDGNVAKILGKDGFEIDNEKKDGKLGVADILNQVAKPYFAEADSGNNGGGGNGNSGGGQVKVNLTGTNSDRIIADMKDARD